MNQIDTAADIKAWILNNNPGNVLEGSAELVDQLAEAIRTADGRPAWREDWSEWLDARAEKILEEVVAACSHAARASDAYAPARRTIAADIASGELKPGDYIEIRFIRGTQIAIFVSIKGEAVKILRWLDSKGSFGNSIVRVHANEYEGIARERDPRTARARVEAARLDEAGWHVKGPWIKLSAPASEPVAIRAGNHPPHKVFSTFVALAGDLEALQSEAYCAGLGCAKYDMRSQRGDGGVLFSDATVIAYMSNPGTRSALEAWVGSFADDAATLAALPPEAREAVLSSAWAGYEAGVYQARDAARSAGSAPVLKHYRVSRPEVYGPATPGHTKLSARQGYYVDAADPAAARKIIRERHGFEDRLDVQDWSDGPEHGRLIPEAGPVLIHDATKEPVQIGEIVTVRGERYKVTGWRAPKHAASSGRILVTPEDGKGPQEEYYPTVFACHFEAAK